ncbi:MAG: hypothetical protein JOZ47_10320 [Kutzneria sp.]|nr:hypothetical protein [Kutzneria sp.]
MRGPESQDGRLIPAESAVLDRALDWLTANLAWFRPGRWDQFFPVRAFPGTTALELLLVCRALLRGPRAARVTQFVQSALDIAEDVVDHPDFTAGLHRLDDQFPYHAWLVVLMERLGRPAGQLRSTVRALVESHRRELGRASMSPQKSIELNYILGLADIDCGQTDPDGPEVRQALPLQGDPSLLDDDEVYTVTHMLFYVTDFAARPVLPGGEEGRQRLRTVVRTLLDTYLTEGHWDLCAELLLCAQALGDGDDELANKGWRHLAAAQREDGSVPGPPFRPSVLAERCGAKAAAYVFRTCYHPTLVTALAAAERERLHDVQG